MIHHIIRRAIRDWLNWRRDKQVERVMPDIIARKRKIAAAKLKHKAIKPIVIEQRNRMTDVLRGM